MQASGKALAALAVLGLCAVSATAAADGNRANAGFQRIAGTYVVDATLLTIAGFDCEFLVDVGAAEICDGRIYLTLHTGGTVTATDTNDFGDVREPTALGNWSRDRGPGRNVTIRTLTPGYDPMGEQVGAIVRELNVSFDWQASTFTGTLDAKVLNVPKDPLDPAAEPDLVITGAVSGRRFD